LTAYLDSVRGNQFGSFYNKRLVVQDLIHLDASFAAALDAWRDPPSPVALMLLMRSHAAFRAGAGAAMAGQIAEAPCLLRLCIECAGYAAIIHRDDALAEVFVRRSDGDEARKKVRKEFNPGRITNVVANFDPGLSKVFTDLYEGLIDFGAHPNEAMLITSSRSTKAASERKLEVAHLSGDGLPLDFTLKRSVQAGLWAAKVLIALHAERAKRTGMDAVVAEMASRY
jgi:hypothetical protein